MTPSNSIDTSDKNPETGDSSNPAIYIALMGIALFALVLLFVKKRKNVSK